MLKDDELASFLQSSSDIAKLFNTDTGEKTLQVKNITLTEKLTISFL